MSSPAKLPVVTGVASDGPGQSSSMRRREGLLAMVVHTGNMKNGGDLEDLCFWVY